MDDLRQMMNIKPLQGAVLFKNKIASKNKLKIKAYKK